MPTKQEHTNKAKLARYKERAEQAEQALTEAQTEINTLHQRLNDALAEVVTVKAGRDKWRAIVADVMDARVMKNIGLTGGGNPAIYYDTVAVGEAIAGLGKCSLALTSPDVASKGRTPS